MGHIISFYPIFNINMYTFFSIDNNLSIYIHLINIYRKSYIIVLYMYKIIIYIDKMIYVAKV